MNKEKMMAAIDVIRSGNQVAILKAVPELDDGELMCVEMVLELTAPPAKRKRSDAGKPRKAAQGAS